MTDISPQCFRIEPSELIDCDPCPCCGEIARAATGTVLEHGAACAAYRVHWTKGQANRATWEFVVGAWGDGATAADRFVVRADYRYDFEPAIMIVDADGAASYPALASTCLRRSEVIGTPLAPHIFAIYDTIVLDDGRLAELHPWRAVR